MRPIAACAGIVVERTRVSQVTPESPGIPYAVVYGLLRALPGDRLVDTVAGEKISGSLPPAPRRQAHAAWPSARPRPRQKRSPRPPHPAPNVRDDRDTPLKWDGMLSIYSCFGYGVKKNFGKSELRNFCRWAGTGVWAI